MGEINHPKAGAFYYDLEVHYRKRFRDQINSKKEYFFC